MFSLHSDLALIQNSRKDPFNGAKKQPSKSGGLLERSTVTYTNADAGGMHRSPAWVASWFLVVVALCICGHSGTANKPSSFTLLKKECIME